MSTLVAELLARSVARLVNTLRSRIRLNSQPKHGQYHPADDAEVAEPISERRAAQHRKPDV